MPRAARGGRARDDDDGEYELTTFGRVQLRVDWSASPRSRHARSAARGTRRERVPDDTDLGDGEGVRFGPRAVERGERREPFTIAGRSGAGEEDGDEDEDDA